MSSTTPDAPAEQMAVTRYTYRYHNDSINTLNILLLGLVVLIAILGFFIFVQLSTEPKPLVYKLDQEYQIIASVPLDQEGLTTPALLNWVNKFVMEAFSFNYSNIQNQASKLAPYFNDTALKIYADLFNTDQDFRSIIPNNFVVSVIPKAAPQILVGKAFKGRYAWEIQVPATIIFSNAIYKATQDVTLSFLVWRVPPTQAAQGVIVATFTHTVTGRTGIQGLRQTI